MTSSQLSFSRLKTTEYLPCGLVHMKKAIIIGSGIGGLASALRMRHKGYEVEVIEQNGYPGGKLTEIRADGYRWDAGPSLFTMPHLVTELIELFGRDVSEHFSYNRQEEVCRYWWEDGMTFTVDADPSTFINDAASTFSIDPSRLHQYLKDSRFKYDHTSPLFLERSLHKASTYLSKDTLKALVNVARMDLSKSLHDYNLQMLEEPHLVQLFDRYATYNGSSPYQTPGIMSMIPHLEMDIGTYFPEGGMHSITQALYNLAADVGITFCWNHAVDQIIIENRKAKGVRIKNEILKADVVISNMDIYPTYNKLLPDVSPPRNTLTQERSSSALIFYWGVKGIHEHFGLHNILFSGQYRSEFESLFDRHEIGDDPTVYINITSKIESLDAPPG
ncbi:MAG: 1-hydroxycarotenoid 3,4-desaturase CrtD, partial [Bacteroidota bacterium]